MTTTPTHIASRLELFADETLIESLTGGAALRLHRPTAREVALVCDQPWEGNMCGGYKTYFRDDDRFRMYYQQWHGEFYQEDGKNKLRDRPIRIGYAESTDGIHWHKPRLGLYEFEGSKENNITFMGEGADAPGVHGFAPMKDANPDAAPDARYKALGASNIWPYKLFALKSADGVRWSLMRPEPVLTEGYFDSHNGAFWDAERGEYRLYFRDADEGFFRGVKTCTSTDFLNWSKAQWLEYPGSPREQLYTNMISPYHRAPHLLLGFPTRYTERPWSPAIEALPEVEHRRLRASVSERYGAAVTDGLFMAGRDRTTFKRWGEAFIRPGLRPTSSWAYGDCYQGWGLIETPSEFENAPPELSMFANEGYWRGNSNRIRRYSLRMDGFVSVQAPLAGGEVVTKPITFAGNQLRLNASTSAAGIIHAELQNPDGSPIQGFTLDDCHGTIGDDLALPVAWKDASLSTLAGRPVRLRLRLSDADVFAYRFAP